MSPNTLITDIIPGMEWPIAEITLRICGTTEIKRKTRSILKVLRTESAPVVGIQAIATINRSKMFQLERKNLNL